MAYHVEEYAKIIRELRSEVDSLRSQLAVTKKGALTGGTDTLPKDSTCCNLIELKFGLCFCVSVDSASSRPFRSQTEGLRRKVSSLFLFQQNKFAPLPPH